MIKKIGPSSLMKGKGLDKKSILYLIVIVAAVIICIGVVYYLSQTEIEEKSEEPEETLIERQLRKLDELRGDTPPLSEEEIQEQLEELDELRGDTPPLSEEEIQEQLEELDKLHQDSQ